MRNKLVVILLLAATVAAGISSYFGREWAAEALETGPFIALVEAKPIPLNLEQSDVRKSGDLTYVAGWALTAENEDFGGFSGMVVGADGASLVAINDKGNWFTANLDIDAPAPLSDGLLYPFESDMGVLAKIDYDAESLIRRGDKFLVSFEQEHRILEVDAVGGANRPSEFNHEEALGQLSRNSGLEAISLLSDGRLLMFAERGLDQQGTLPAWIADKDGVEARRFATIANYAPTDAATLPNGDVLLLLRHYSQLDGVSVKLLLLKAEEMAGDAVLKGQELMHLEPPYSVDNMEALDAFVLEDGTVRIFMLSDDNFNPLQQTLLMVFDWKPVS